jgi:hypothetical protein
MPVTFKQLHAVALAAMLCSAHTTLAETVKIAYQNYTHGQQVSPEAKEYLAGNRPDIQIVSDDFVPIATVRDFAPYLAKTVSIPTVYAPRPSRHCRSRACRRAVRPVAGSHCSASSVQAARPSRQRVALELTRDGRRTAAQCPGRGPSAAPLRLYAGHRLTCIAVLPRG